MKKKIIGICLSVVMTAGALTASAQAATVGGAVVNTGLRLRSGTGTSYATLAVAQAQDKVILRGQAENGWYPVIYKGQAGYMSGKYLTPSTALTGDFGTGTVRGTDVRFRSGPGTDSKVLGSVHTGTTMTVTGVNGPWYQVSHRGTAGYVHSDYLSLTAAPAAETGTIRGTQVRFRASPNTSGKILGVFQNGDTVTILGTQSAWKQVKYKGTTGYVHGDYVVTGGGHTAAPEAAAIMATARQYLGVPYVYGGTTPSGFDCSGLMQYVFRQHGITLSRTAALQYANNGTHVSRDDLRPGDLLFFSNSSNAVGHVGLYMGEDKMLHASSGAGKVIISDITSTYYVNHYVGAKRVL